MKSTSPACIIPADEYTIPAASTVDTPTDSASSSSLPPIDGLDSCRPHGGGGDETGHGRSSGSPSSPNAPPSDASTTTKSVDFDADPQTTFTKATQLVALTPRDVKKRLDRVNEVGARFLASVNAAFEGFPPVELFDGGRTMFTQRDKASIEAATELHFVDVGGRAGGVKAVHKRRGLFVKFAFDQEGIYGSMAMAAKAAKREAAASRWVHAMDSIHVNTPLLECVDL